MIKLRKGRIIFRTLKDGEIKRGRFVLRQYGVSTILGTRKDAERIAKNLTALLADVKNYEAIR